jgi:hypothetical protein
LRLPKNLLSDSYRPPAIYLCQTNKDRIGELNVSNFKGKFKWNAYSEISFDIDRKYCDITTGNIILNPCYDKVEGLRLVFVEGFGYFQLQDPEMESDGIKETKSMSANSLEYDLSNRYLESFIINKGTTGSIDGVQLYNPNDVEHSLLHLVIKEKAPDWHIGHVDADLATQKRFFEIDRKSVYDFLMKEMSNTFKCVIIFDTYDNSINVYKEETAGIDTDVTIAFDNLATKIQVDYSADDIKTVLTIKGADDLTIREINYGLPYITDLSYYHTVDWMGQDLYDAYNNYLQVISAHEQEYQDALASIRKYNVIISELKNRAKQDLTSSKINDFLDFLIDFYKNNKVDPEKMATLDVDFVYLDKNDWTSFKNTINSNSATSTQKEIAIENILDIIWEAYGLNTLKVLEASYKGVQVVQTENGMSDAADEDYYQYHANYTMLITVQKDIAQRNVSIAEADKKLDEANVIVNKIAQLVSIQNNFSNENIIRLAPFLREDEYSDDNFVVTDIDTEEDRAETLKALLNAGYEELHKMSQPKLSFKTSIANVYALDEFTPIIDQFQLGNMIKIEIRDDYIKKSRLMEVEIDFHDLKNFSVTFGDLLSIRDEADIHADLLARAINAGKSVANNASAWQKGSDAANEIKKSLNQGLLDAATEIKSIDGLQSVSLDNYGIHLRKKIGDSGEFDPEQGWIVSNKFLYTDDNWKTTKSVFGKYTHNGQEKWGVLAEAVVGGYIQGSEIEGGTIRIGKNPETGEYTFIVTADGRVQINAWGGELSDKINEVTDRLDAYSVSIESSSVPMFDENVRSTILICYIMQNNQKVPAPSGTTYSWIRASNDATADVTWNDDVAHKNNTSNVIVIDADDVDNSARFTCEVYIP